MVSYRKTQMITVIMIIQINQKENKNKLFNWMN